VRRRGCIAAAFWFRAPATPSANLAIFVNNLAPGDLVEPVGSELYRP
jgi:hypothetical protein